MDIIQEGDGRVPPTVTIIQEGEGRLPPTVTVIQEGEGDSNCYHNTRRGGQGASNATIIHEGEGASNCYHNTRRGVPTTSTIIQEGEGASNCYHNTRRGGQGASNCYHNTRRGGCLQLIPQDKKDKVSSISQLKRLDTRQNKYGPSNGKTIECCACSAKNKETGTQFRCPEWDVVWCASPYCEVYHTKLYFWESSYTELEKWSTQT